jgi:hypothetical protein
MTVNFGSFFGYGRNLPACGGIDEAQVGVPLIDHEQGLGARGGREHSQRKA